MKTLSLSLRNQISIILLVVSLSSVSSCKKETAETHVSEEVAAEIITNAVSSERGGFVSQVDNSISIANRHSLSSSCGQQKDTTLAVNYSGLAVSYAYNLNWKWNLICTSNVPSKFTYNYTGTSNYDGITMLSNDIVNSALEVSGLQHSASNYVVTKQVIREGKFQSKHRTQSMYTSKVKMTTTNLTVEKSTHKIKSGKIHTKLNVNNSSSAYHGDITFHGNNTATLVLSSGKTYTIRW